MRFNDDVAILMHEMESVYGKEITELTIDLSSLHFLEYFGVQYESQFLWIILFKWCYW